MNKDNFPLLTVAKPYHYSFNNNKLKFKIMSTFVSTTFGKISGRHGSAVAAIVKNGKNVLKVFTAPFNPKSVKQVAQRTKFKFVITTLNCMNDLFKITFHGLGEFHHAVSLALKNAVTGTSPNYSLDYTKLVMSEGSVYGASQLTAAKTTGTSVSVNWVSSLLPTSALATDNVNLIFFNEAAKEVVLKQNCALRPADTIEVDLPAEWSGANIHTWIYFSLADGSRNSLSEYISEVQL